jgi:hypothetical protein
MMSPDAVMSLFSAWKDCCCASPGRDAPIDASRGKTSDDPVCHDLRELPQAILAAEAFASNSYLHEAIQEMNGSILLSFFNLPA